MKKQIPKIIGISAIIIVLIFVGFQILFPLEKRIQPLFETKTIELGDTLESDITTYIEGFEKAVAQSQLDISQVDTYTAGNYEAYVTLGERTITYCINVTDTVKPELTLNTEVDYIATNRDYAPQYFVKDVFDLSGTAEIYFDVGGSLEQTINLESTGEYEVCIVAKDISGNETAQTTTVTVDSAPILIGIENATIPIGTDYNFVQGVVAVDEVDGIITDQIVVNTDTFNATVSGDYEVTYSVSDSYGIETTKNVTITVSENAPKDYGKSNSLTLEELQILCDFKYFTYEPLEIGNYDEVIELVKPTSVNIQNKKTVGCGFIYKVTPQYVYIGSVNHVTKHFKNGGTLLFHNDVSIPITYENERANSTNELSMFKIETSQIPKDTLLTLKEAHVDINIYDKLETNEPLIQYCENFAWTNEQKIKKTNLIDIFTSLQQINYIDCCITTKATGLVGMSGSPLYDYKGNLIGSISSEYNSKDYHMRIDMLEELKERLDE